MSSVAARTSALALIVVAGCAPTSTRSASVLAARSLATATIDPRSPPDSDERLARLETPIVQWIPSFGSVEREAVIVDDSERATLVLFDSVRAVIEPRGPALSVSIANERTVQPLIAAAPRGAGWLFLSRDGTSWAADSFLGPLRFVGESSLGPRSADRGAGALAFVDGALRGWLSDGSSLRRWPEDAALSVAFADERFGAAVLADGRVALTDDGGARTFEAALEPAAAPSRVRLLRGALVLETSRGPREIRRDGSLVATDRVGAHRSLSHEQSLALLEAVARRWPRAITNGDGHALSPNKWASVGRTLLRFDARTGALRASFRDALPSSSCSFTGWGSRVVLRCAEGRFNAVFTPGRGLTPLPWHRSGVRVELSDDGEHALIDESCQELEANTPTVLRAGLCALDREGRLHTLWRQRARGTFWSLRGAVGLLEDLGDNHSTLFLVDAERRTVDPIATGNEQGAFVFTGAGIAPDETIWRLLPSEDGRDARLALRRSGATRVVSLPDGHRSAAVASARELLAVGADIEHLSLSTDGGERWSAVELRAIRGHSQRFSTYSDDSRHTTWRCSEDGCQFYSLWFGHDPVPDGDAVVAAPTAPRAAPAATPPILAGTVIDCADRRASSAPHEPVGAEWGSYSIGVTALDRQRVSLDVRWRLARDPRTLRAISQGNVALENGGRLFDLDPRSAWRVVVADERFALIERCVSGGVHSRCDRFIASNAELRALRELDALGPCVGAARRDDGAWVILLGATQGEYRGMAIVGRDGALRAARELPPSVGEWDRDFIALRGALAGVLVHTRRERSLTPAFVALFDGDRPIAPRVEPLSIVAGSRTSPCPAQRARGAITVWSSSRNWMPLVRSGDLDSSSYDSSAVFEASSDRPACVRSVFFSSRATPDAAAFALRVDGSGSMVATLERATGARSLVCSAP